VGAGAAPDAGATGRLLVRSGIEIARVLERLRAERAVLSALLGEGDLLFLTRLLAVEHALGAIVVAFSESKPANAQLLARESVVFACNHDGLRHEFIAAGPRETRFQGAPAMRLDFPRVLLSSQRRSHARIAVPPAVPLDCVFDWGGAPVRAKVVDLSRGGIGALVHQAAVSIPPGARLENVRVAHPRHTVTVALEVRHAARASTPDGRPATRLGCRFAAAPRDLRELLALFVTEIGGG